AAADAARLDLETRLDVIDRLLERLHRIVAGLLFDDVEALVEDPLRSAPLAVAHHAVDELADQRAVVKRIRRNVALRNLSSSWHRCFPMPSSAASRRTSSGPASGPARRLRRACRAPRGSERP